MKSSDLPEYTLIIHYATLSASQPKVRLETLAAIGKLLATPHQSMDIDSLTTDTQAQDVLRNWLSGENVREFWEIVHDEVVPQSTCEKHILVGTLQLMTDLSAVAVQPSSLKLSDLDTVWRAADVFVSQHLKQSSMES